MVFVLHFLYGRKEIISMLEDGGKIRAIRMYRLATGEGLMESKKHIDEIENEMKNLYTTTEEGLSFSEENIT
jgi:ribosomal protein L7/L12